MAESIFDIQMESVDPSTVADILFTKRAYSSFYYLEDGAFLRPITNDTEFMECVAKNLIIYRQTKIKIIK